MVLFCFCSFLCSFLHFFLRFGFVEFSSQEEATAALSAMNGSEIDGRSISIDYAAPKGEGGARGGRGGFGGDRGGRGGMFSSIVP